MKVGYARVSTDDQLLDIQLNALKEAGCEIIYQEKMSSIKHRKQLRIMIDNLQPQDIVYVYKLDRLGRSLTDLVFILNDISNKKADFVSIIDKFDTTTTQGKLILGISMVFAEFERNIIADRTKAGLQTAKAKGVKLGRVEYLDKLKVKEAKRLKKLHFTPEKIQKELNISKSTLYRYLGM